MKLKLTLLSLVLVTLYSCGFDASKYYTPSEANASKASMSVEDLVTGRAKYIATCGKCHRLYKPDRNSSSEWTIYLDDMQERSHISNKEKQQIFKYLTSEISE
ncbi:MAG: mono/diheme cytochrome c family protein [Planctomycetota bacterium]|mgnify:CR=1 FL=1|jgi:mono/diheme cytochrome c family protein